MCFYRDPALNVVVETFHFIRIYTCILCETVLSDKVKE